MPTRTLFYGGTVYAEDGPYPQGWVLVEQGQIAQIGQGEPPTVDGAQFINLAGQALAPGLIDLHVHGALGYDTMDATPEALERMARFYAQHGVTAFVATTMTGPTEAILAALDNLAAVMRTGTGGAALLGAHVEGPYLDLQRRGAHDPAYVRGADPTEYQRLFETGVVRVITLSPETPANQELIRFAVSQGATVAAGHTRASFDEMRHAVELGVTQVTHLFNGMEPLHHREPGVVGAALSLDAIRCQVIADNIHIHPAVLKLAVRAKGPDGVILISDAMCGVGMPDGDYVLGGLPVTVRQGIARVANGALAGSTLTMERAVQNIQTAADLPLADALRMATLTPARALGLEARKGSVAIGKDADLIVLDAGLNVTLTMVGGEIVHRLG